MSSDFSIGDYARHGAAHPNPTYDFLSGFAPRKIKDLFRWSEYLYANAPAIFAALQKLSAYPVTEVKVAAEGAARKDVWEDLLTDTLDVRNHAILTNLDRRLYGNSFTSIYKPFVRTLCCNHQDCKKLTGITHVKYTFQLKTMKFKYTCAACKRATVGDIRDLKSVDRTKISLIRWAPALIDINYNPITGRSEYYYTIPSDIRTKVEKGDPHLMATIPLEFLKAIQAKKTFKFSPDQIFHMKMPAPAGIDAQWGLPPLVSTIKLFFYAAVLRKANEAIALDHIVPFRVLHPAPISGNADPAERLNMANWQAQLESNIKQWRRDPLHIMFAPAALGVTMMGGQGRSLLTLGEVKDAEDAIIAALGVPREFLYGGLTVTGSAITLRMLENQLESDAKQLNDQLAWIIRQLSVFLEMPKVKARFVPFKLVDDTEQKMALLNLQQVTGGAISNSRLMEGYSDLDLDDERKKKEEEALAQAKSDADLQQKMQRLQTSASAQAEQSAQMGAGLGYNPTAVIQQADQYVQQFTQMDPGTRQSQMDQLSQTDPVMYAVVKDRMEANAQSMKHQAVTQARAGGAPI